MKKKSLIITIGIVLASISLFNSCSNDDLDASKESFVLIENEKVNIINNTLSFQDQFTFESVLKKMKLRNSNINNGFTLPNINPYTDEKVNQIDGFFSLYDSFNEALGKADNYYQNEDDYNKFKELYANLYFPEYKEDYSVYLPVDDEDLAKLLNLNGDVYINGKLINMKNIDNYERLQELGIAMYQSNVVIPKRSKIREYPRNYVEMIITLGEEYIEGKTKYWLTISDSNHLIYTFNVNFRKKGFLGFWYNLKANSICPLEIFMEGFDYPYYHINSNLLKKINFSTFGVKSPHTYIYNHQVSASDIATGRFNISVDGTSNMIYKFYLK